MDWQSYTPVYTGFSVDPFGANRVLFMLIGKLLVLSHHPSDGTSNATGFTIGLPSGLTLANNIHASCRTINNGAPSTAAGLLAGTENETSLTVHRDHTGASWTASAAKNATFTVALPVN